MADKYVTIQSHQPLRVPLKWDRQEKALIVQLEEIFDDIYRRYGRLTLEDMDKKFRKRIEDDEKGVAELVVTVGEISESVSDIDGTMSGLKIIPAGIDIQGGKYIYLESGSELQIKSGGDLNVESGANTNIKSGGNLNVKSGGGVAIESGGSFAVKNASNSNAIKMDNGGIDIESGADINIKSGADVNIKSGGNVNVESGGAFTVKNSSSSNVIVMNDSGIDIESGGDINIKSGGSFSVQSGGTFDVDAANLKIDSAAGYLTTGYWKFYSYGVDFNSGDFIVGPGYTEVGPPSGKFAKIGPVYGGDVYEKGFGIATNGNTNRIYMGTRLHSLPSNYCFVMEPDRASTGDVYKLGESGATHKWDIAYIDSVQQSSSREIKHGIRPIAPVGERLDALQPVSFIYNKDKTETVHQGLIYEDTVDVLPEICYEEDGEKSINYVELVPLLLREIKDLRHRVAMLEEKAYV